MTVICELVLSGRCKVKEEECQHSVPHEEIKQTTGGTCMLFGECVLEGRVRCIKEM